MNKLQNTQDTRLVSDRKWVGSEFGKYRVEKIMYGKEPKVTLQAIDKENQKSVVLKVFRSASEAAKREFEKEIKILNKLESKHGVLKPLEVFAYQDDYFIVTEYKSGGSLRGWLNKSPKMAEILDIFSQIAASIDYVHANRIVHRDVKPENVVYDISEGRVVPYLIDFGISVTLPDTTSSFRTENGFGTIRYMAPEFFSNKNARKTSAVDIYAFGLMLYEALENCHPIDAKSDHEIIAQIAYGPVPFPENTRKKLGDNAGNILMETLSKNPEDRPKTATEIILQIKGQYAEYLGKAYGKYVIEKYIGQGLYGTTYKAHDVNNTNKKFSLKVLTAPKLISAEINELKKLDRSKGIMPVIEVGNENGTQYVVSEYLNGNNLRDLLQSFPDGMDLQDAVKIFKSIAATLDYLHGKAIIHQDLKPENILLRKNRIAGDFLPFINDYGVSKMMAASESLYAKNNIPLGILNYLAPELLSDKHPSPSTDIYSLGVIIYEAVEGKVPFDAKSLSGLIKQKLTSDVPSPRNLLNNGGIRAAQVLLKSLSVEPGHRQGSASELVSEFDDAIKKRTFTDSGIFIEPWIIMRKLFSSFKMNFSILPSLWVFFLLLLCFGATTLLSSFGRSLTPTITYIRTAETPAVMTISPSSTDVPLVNIPLPPASARVSCDPSFPSSEPDWIDEYTAKNSIYLSKIYEDKYGGSPLSKYDLYAIAYFNNRKIRDGNLSYHAIDPANYDLVKKGWKIFLPPPSWIKIYREFPIAIPKIEHIISQSKISISGSSELFPLSSIISECFIKKSNFQQIPIMSNNTESGLSDFCQGQVNLFVAGREITEEMSEMYGCKDVKFYSFQIARFPIAIFINMMNPNLNNIQDKPLENRELEKLFTSAKYWSDVRPSWDRELIVRYYPPLSSDTFEIVKEKFFPNWMDFPVSNLNLENDNAVAYNVARNKFAIGFSSYSEYVYYQDYLTTIPVDGASPSPETIDEEDPTYHLIATVYLHTGKNVYDNNPSLQNFINYYLSREFEFISGLGYMRPDKEQYLKNTFR